jgi:hypothetical protein
LQRPGDTKPLAVGSPRQSSTRECRGNQGPLTVGPPSLVLLSAAHEVVFGDTPPRCVFDRPLPQQPAGPVLGELGIERDLEVVEARAVLEVELDRDRTPPGVEAEEPHPADPIEVPDGVEEEALRRRIGEQAEETVGLSASSVDLEERVEAGL